MNRFLLVGTTALLTSFSATAQWAESTPGTAPSGRGGHGMTFDPTTGNVLLFGGDTLGFPSGPVNDTWSYDGTTWTNLNPTGGIPISAGIELVYDSNRGLFVTYGSLNTSFFGGPSEDRTWEYDPAANAWAENLLLTTTPGGLGLYGMAFDSNRNVTVLYGGVPDNFFPIDSSQTWEYDGNNWTLATPANNPGPLERPGMCFHDDLDVTVLFGGIDVQVGGNDTTWLYDGTDWTQAGVTGTRPSVRTGCQMVYDSVRQVCVMTGGQDPTNGTPFNDTWELTLDATGNGTWVAVTAAPYTDARLEAGLAFDPNRRQVVMFGGLNFMTFQAYGDTWEHGAKSATFGTGCAGTNGVPALDALDAPRLGQPYVLQLDHLNFFFSLGFVALSLNAIAPVPLDGIGMTGCTGYVAPDVLLSSTGSNGSTTLSVSMPTSPVLIGTEIFSQALSFDPGLNPAWLIVSNGLQGTLGA